jgi:hypothetical protein
MLGRLLIGGSLASSEAHVRAEHLDVLKCGEVKCREDTFPELFQVNFGPRSHDHW